MTRLVRSLLLTSLTALAAAASAPDAKAQVFVGFGFGAPCAPVRVWVPGHFEVLKQTVWVPGSSRQVWIAPAYATRFDACGRAYQVCSRPGHWRTITEPGRYETRRVRAWIDGYWRFQ